MSKNNRQTLAGLEISAAAALYNKSRKTLAAAMDAQRAAFQAASDAQDDLLRQRENVAHVMRRHGHNYVRVEGLLLSVDEEGLTAVEDQFTTLSAN